MSKLKVAIIGVGGIARTHVPGWTASEDADLVAAADINEDGLKRWGKEHDVAKLVTEPAALFADPNIDIIDICTPNNYHAPLAIAAMEAGKHVICEKPLAPTPALIRDMIAARDKSGTTLMAAQHFRFSGASKALKTEIDKGALGDVYHARSWMLRRAGLIPTASFIQKEHAGGGPCIDIGVHILDLTLWMMGNPAPVAVTGVARKPLVDHHPVFSAWSKQPVPRDIFDVEEMAAAFVRFDNGATLVIEVSWLLHHEHHGGEDMQMWLYGTDGGSHWPSCTFLSTDYGNKQFQKQELQLIVDEMEPHALECVEFARAVRDGEPSPVPAEQSLQVLTILDGIYRSQEAGAEVKL